MKRFLQKILLLITICIFIFSLIAAFDVFIIGSQYRYNYEASILDKVARLESIDEPKIILVGHSNLAFGMDSKLLEDEIGMPVVNLGLHGALGNSFHEEIAKLNINEGDLVIVCHTDYSLRDKIYDTPLAWVTVDNNAEIWDIIRPKDYPEMLMSYPEYLKNSFLLWITRTGNLDEGGCYSRSALNEYGDVVYKPEEEQIDPDTFFADTDTNPVNVPAISDECIAHLNEYNKYINDRGATMLIAGYPIAYGEYSTFTEDDFREFGKELQDKLDCDVISDYTDYFYPYEYFYDTTFHLNEEGTEARTRQLIEDLQKWMDCAQP